MFSLQLDPPAALPMTMCWAAVSKHCTSRPSLTGLAPAQRCSSQTFLCPRAGRKFLCPRTWVWREPHLVKGLSQCLSFSMGT